MTEQIIAEYAGAVHSQIQVAERGHVRFMRFGTGGGWQGAIDKRRQERPVFAYQRAFQTFLRALSAVDSFLALGVGSGTAINSVREAFPKCQLFGVELDEVVIRAAIRHFGAPSHHEATYWVGDGVTLLCETDVEADVLFVDAYMSNRVYAACVDPMFATVLKAATTRQGIAVCNLITSFPLTGRIKAFLQAAQLEFASVTLLPVGPPLPFSEQNVLAILSKREDITRSWTSAIRRHPAPRMLERMLWPLRVTELSRPV